MLGNTTIRASQMKYNFADKGVPKLELGNEERGRSADITTHWRPFL